MKMALFTIICLLLLCPPSIGHSEERIKVDGYKWNEWGKSGDLGKSLKIGFVVGWAECSSLVIGNIPDYITYATILGIITEEKLKTHQKIVEAFSKEKGLELWGVTPGQVVDMIDKVYSDPRVKTWEISDIMPLVRGRLREGWTEKDLDEVIAYVIKEREFYKKYGNSKNGSEAEKYRKESWELSSEEPKVLKKLRAYRFQ